MAEVLKKYRFKGHESFILREGWLNKGLTAVAADPKVFQTFFGADALGVGPNMAKAIKYWLAAAGLISVNRGDVLLTDKGKLILEYDPYIEDIFTLWVIHSDIVRNSDEATAWYLFFNDFEMDMFSREELVRGMNVLASEAAGEGKNASAASVAGDCDAILQMYVRQRQENYDPEEKKVSPFYTLGLIRYEEGRYRKRQPDAGTLDPMAVWYGLVPFMGQGSISLDSLVSGKKSPGKLMNLRRTAVSEYIDILADRGMLSVNHTAGLDMVYFTKKQSGEEIIGNYYKNR